MTETVQWPELQVGETLSQGVDWELPEGVTITASAWSFINQAGLIKSSDDFSDAQTQVVLTGGNAGEYAVIKNQITTTSAGVQPYKLIYLPIVAYAPIDLTLSYADLDTADAYASARNWTDWAAATAVVKAAALLHATDYLDATYRWPGNLMNYTTQVLGWPRAGAYDRDGRYLTGIPSAVVAATIEAARLALTAPLTGGNDLNQPQLIRKKTGPLEKEWARVDQGTLQSNRMAFVSQLLSKIGAGGGANSIRLVRA